MLIKIRENTNSKLFVIERSLMIIFKCSFGRKSNLIFEINWNPLPSGTVNINTDESFFPSSSLISRCRNSYSRCRRAMGDCLLEEKKILEWQVKRRNTKINWNSLSDNYERAEAQRIYSPKRWFRPHRSETFCTDGHRRPPSKIQLLGSVADTGFLLNGCLIQKNCKNKEQ